MSYLKQMQLKELERIIPIARRTFHNKKKYIKLQRKLDMLLRRIANLKKQKKELESAYATFKKHKINVNAIVGNIEIQKIEEKKHKLEEEIQCINQELPEISNKVNAEEDYIYSVSGFFKQMHLTKKEIPEQDVYIILYILWIGQEFLKMSTFFEDSSDFLQMLKDKHVDNLRINPVTNSLDDFYKAYFKDIFC